METIQIAPFYIPATSHLQIDREPLIPNVDQYLESTLYSIENQFTDYDTGFPISEFDHTLGDYDSQNHSTDIGNIGRSLLVASAINRYRNYQDVGIRTQAANTITTLRDVMCQGELYRNGAFTAELDVRGMPTESPSEKPASPDQHGMLLHGLRVASESFMQYRGDCIDLMKNIVFEGYSHQQPITRIQSYGDIPKNTKDNIIHLHRNKNSPSKTRPADIFQNLLNAPERTLQEIQLLIDTHPGIFLPLVGFMEDIDPETNQPKPTQQYKDQIFILLTLFKRMESSNSQAEDTNTDLQNEEIELLKAA